MLINIQVFEPRPPTRPVWQAGVLSPAKIVPTDDGRRADHSSTGPRSYRRVPSRCVLQLISSILHLLPSTLSAREFLFLKSLVLLEKEPVILEEEYIQLLKSSKYQGELIIIEVGK